MNKKPKEMYLKENFEIIVKKSRSLKEVLENLGILCRGGSYATVKKYIELYNIDISHFYTKKDLYNKTIGNYVNNKLRNDLSEILIENSKFKNSSHLKNRLYKEGIKDRKCEKCEQTENWRGKKMSLILDHINGNPTDNRLENLQILCPNCNATTETFSKGHKKLKKQEENKNFCSCGKEINKNSKNCINCIDKTNLRKVNNRPEYNVLKKEIIDMGYSATGRKYGVSDNAVRKWIKNYEKQMQ
jgi:hypothetical protein